MTVQHEIKSQLAKLLATEDLIVEHKKVETAFFNVSSRVLTLPLWDKASNIVYDMLVGHEVGHALYTPDEEWWKRYKVPPSFVNIIEDVRIEKLMKRRYAGLSKSFYYGYQELNDDNFFSIDPDNLEEMGFADRINLHFKIGNFVDVPFLNTLILLMSGTTCTWAHHAVREGHRDQAIQALWCTVGLGIFFSFMQGVEYYEAAHHYFSFTDGIYPSVFYMATGFHGFHVMVGTAFLAVCLYRVYKNHFTPDRHFGLEAAAWYWHFVDVVWLFLFVCVYVWGA